MRSSLETSNPRCRRCFPLVAYQQVKDVTKPERDYKFRLLANFKRAPTRVPSTPSAQRPTEQVRRRRRVRKGRQMDGARIEGNKLGYFRVLRSRLRFTLPTGRSREFELTSLISWRGEWYVVHLHGFK